MKVRRSEGYEDANPKNARQAINQWAHRGYVVKVSDDNDNYSFIFRKLKKN